MKEKDKGGRPAMVLDAEQIELVSGLSAVLNKTQLANYFGMCENTFREVETRQPEVSEAYKKGRNQKIAAIGNNLVAQALEGNLTASMFYLKTQAGWKETQHVQQETKEVKSFSDMYGDS